MPFLYRVHEAPNDYRRFTFEGIKNYFQKKKTLKILKFKTLGDVYDVTHTIINEGIFSKNLITKIFEENIDLSNKNIKTFDSI